MRLKRAASVLHATAAAAAALTAASAACLTVLLFLVLPGWPTHTSKRERRNLSMGKDGGETCLPLYLRALAQFCFCVHLSPTLVKA